MYSDFIDGYNLNNDEEFMKCIADMTTLYFNKCLLGYNTLDEVVECKENINVDPRNKYEKINEKIKEGKLLLQSYYLHNHNENVDYDFWEEYLGEK